MARLSDQGKYPQIWNFWIFQLLSYLVALDEIFPPPRESRSHPVCAAGDSSGWVAASEESSPVTGLSVGEQRSGGDGI